MKASVLLFLLSVFIWNCRAQSKSEVISATLSSAKQGDVVILEDFLTTDFPKIAYDKAVMPGPQFMISDDPEYIRIPEAIVMQERTDAGAVRLYVYNVNGVKEPEKMPRKISAVIKNLGEENMHLRMLRYSSQKPSMNYFQIGKQGLYDYFSSRETNNVRTIKPGEVIAIDERLEKQVIMYDELVHGFYEFVIDQPALISVLQTSPDKEGPKAFHEIDTIIPFSHVNAGRGIFPIANYKVTSKDTIDTNDGVSQLIVADGSDDPWITGTIGKKAELARNVGNYGVLYHTSIKWKSTGGKGLALITWNCRSEDSQWCGGMGLTMEMFDEHMKKSVIQYPSNQLVTKAAPEAILIGIYKPDLSKDIQEINFTYSPPGASCLPTPLVLVPIDL
ncbi:copper amine oxidase [Sphingobacterium gobiense]|uniref:Copper amine oxidase n=1 Tax=Sphingobacterium gobiense TaxID=1382456 RepID=A0A2S9JIK9_9SPHI|nr:copper amine oxidase [Sphingobacterium gobiense]PRD52729.1 copper amine oxidase [Sphingobacterium gobiense]